jgi:hypothetical protein
MSKKYIQFLGLVLIFVDIACFHRGDRNRLKPPINDFILDTFEAPASEGIKIESQSGPDFDLVRFFDSKSRRLILNAYIGGSPSFTASVEAHKSLVVEKEVGNLEIKTVSWAVNNSWYREVLLRRKDSVLAGQFHLWYEDLNLEDSKRADEIISQIHYNELRVNELKKLEKSSMENTK